MEDDAHSSPKRRFGGKKALFTRLEVDIIRRDDRPIGVIADAYRVAYDTILRVKQFGRFVNVPYIPRDEVDNRVDPVTGERIQPRMRDFPAPTNGRVGRPFKSGRTSPISNEERALIAADHRPIPEIAAEYGISRSYVKRIRWEENAGMHSGVLTEERIKKIKADDRDTRVVAREFMVPVAVVNHIRGVTSEGNGDEEEDTS